MMGGDVTSLTIKHIHVIISSAKKVDNVILTQVCDKPPCRYIGGYNN